MKVRRRVRLAAMTALLAQLAGCQASHPDLTQADCARVAEHAAALRLRVEGMPKDGQLSPVEAAKHEKILERHLVPLVKEECIAAGPDRAYVECALAATSIDQFAACSPSSEET